MNADAKLLVDILLHSLTEFHHIFTGSSSQVHQDQCLLTIHAGRSEATPLPTTLFYQPPGRHLDSVTHRIMGHLRISALECHKLLVRNHGIHKERTALPTSSGSAICFRLTSIIRLRNNLGSHLLRLNSPSLEFTAYGSIFQIGYKAK